MDKQTAYKIDGKLMDEDDARKYLEELYGKRVLKIADAFLLVTKRGQTIETVERNLGEFTALVDAYRRKQEFEKLVKRNDDD